MRILIIASWYPHEGSPLSGIFTQARARALSKYGCDVTVFFTDIRFRMGSSHAGITEANSHGVREYRYLKKNWTPFWERGVALQQTTMIRKLYRMAFGQGKKPDIIHLEVCNSAMAAVKLAQEEGIPLTYTEHSSAIFNCKPNSFREKLMILAAKNAAHTFWISSLMKNRLAPYCNAGSILPNTVDFSPFSLVPPKTQFTFGALGSLRKIKGYDILLKAFQLVHQKYPECRLILGGNGEELDALQKLCYELSLSKFVEFPGRISPKDRNAFYGKVSAFVCSSHMETFSIVTVEALACGIPVIATKCGGPEDIINEQNGILVEKDDISSLAAGMIYMIKNRNSYLALDIQKDAYTRYNEEAIVKQQISRFQAILAD